MLRTVMDMFRSGQVDFFTLFFMFAAYAVLILVLMPVHEFAHAFVADRLGDKTPRWNGRLTLNPLAHINFVGAAMILLFGIGYAQPVPVSPRHFKNARRDMAFTALAGPVSNLLMAILSVAIFRVLMVFGGGAELRDGILYYQSAWMVYAHLILIDVFASVNIGLAVFNLLPIPPLDGSRIFAAILPRKWANWMDQYEQYITIGLFLLLFTGVLDIPLSLLQNLFCGLIGALFGIPNIL